MNFQSPPSPGDSTGEPDTQVASHGKSAHLIRNAVIVLLLTLASLEIMLRLLGLTTPVLYARDEATGYRLKPNQDVTFLQNRIVINRYGMRDSRSLDARPPSSRRVIVLGDSVTWGGLQITQDDLFTTLAEQKLSGIEVLNAGVNGYSINQMVALYESHLSELQPDYILVCAIQRDFERPPTARLTGDGIAFPEKNPSSAIAMGVAVLRQVLQDRYDWRWLRAPRSAIPVNAEDRPNEDINLESLKRLSDSVPGVILVLLPTLLTVSDRDLKIVSDEHLKDAGIQAYDLRDLVPVSSEDFVDRVHLTEAGHRKIAQAIADVLQNVIDEESEASKPSQALEGH